MLSAAQQIMLELGIITMEYEILIHQKLQRRRKKDVECVQALVCLRQREGELQKCESNMRTDHSRCGPPHYNVH